MKEPRPPRFRNVTIPGVAPPANPPLRSAFEGDEEPTSPNATQPFDADVERSRVALYRLTDVQREAWLRFAELWAQLDTTSAVLLEETAKRFLAALEYRK